jgi:excisionase family DNA binding protein
MKRNEYEGLWRVGDLADHLKLSPKTIRNKVCRGQIPFVKVDGSLRFRPSDIERWISDQNTTPDQRSAA